MSARSSSAVSACVLAVHADGDRRQSLRDPARPDGHRPADASRSTTSATTARSTRRSRLADRRRPGGRARRATWARRSIRPLTTRVVPFNDLAALEAALADRRRSRPADRAGPDEHRHRPARPRLPRGRPRADPAVRHAPDHRRDPHDLCRSRRLHPARSASIRTSSSSARRSVAGSPSATYGFSEAGRPDHGCSSLDNSDVGGIGGTLAGYALSLAAVRATLGEVLTEAAFERMIPLAERWTAGVEEVIAAHGVPWHVTRLGCRAEYHFLPSPAADRARPSGRPRDPELERFLHLYVMNRRILMTPFHNMALMCPATTDGGRRPPHGRLRRRGRRALRLTSAPPRRDRWLWQAASVTARVSPGSPPWSPDPARVSRTKGGSRP